MIPDDSPSGLEPSGNWPIDRSESQAHPARYLLAATNVNVTWLAKSRREPVPLDVDQELP